MRATDAGPLGVIGDEPVDPLLVRPLGGLPGVFLDDQQSTRSA